MQTLKTIANGLKYWVEVLLRNYYTKDESHNQFYTKDETHDKFYTKDETYPKESVYTKDETYPKESVYTKDETYSKDDTNTFVNDSISSFVSREEIAETYASKNELSDTFGNVGFIKEPYYVMETLLTWDGSTTDRETAIVKNRRTLYKISDLTFDIDEIMNSKYKYKYKESGKISNYFDIYDKSGYISDDDSIYVMGGFGLLISKKAGEFTLSSSTTSISTITVNIPSPGVYFGNDYYTNTTMMYQVSLATRKYQSTSPYQRLVIPSSSSGSTKLFAITVNDSGTISASEITT